MGVKWFAKTELWIDCTELLQRVRVKVYIGMLWCGSGAVQNRASGVCIRDFSVRGAL